MLFRSRLQSRWCANRHQGYRPRRKGLSLIELVIVILVLSIVTAAGSGRYADALAYHRAKSAAQRIAADIDAARHAARCQNSSVSITFSASGYTVAGMSNPDHPSAPLTVNLNDGIFQAQLSNVALQDGGGVVGSTLQYNGFGTCLHHGSMTISSGGTGVSLMVVAGTGAVTIP